MKKRTLIIFIGVILIFFVMSWVWKKPQSFLKGVEPDQIKYIAVKNERSGEDYNMNVSEDIRVIIRNIQSASFQKSPMSTFALEALYTLTFYDFDHNKVEEFIVMDDSNFKKDAFFYFADSEISNLTQMIKRADPAIAKESKTLTMEDVIALSKKKEIAWDDLWEFKPTGVTGSGLYIVIYDIDKIYYLVVGNSGRERLGKPVYVKLQKNLDKDGYIDNDPSIDISKEDVKKFIE